MKSVVNNITTYYASSSYVKEIEGTTTTVKKTYMAGSTSIAVRTIVGEEDTLNWVLGDHLGSASVTTTDDGTWFSELRYSAFGETRYSSGITPTDYRYTGQLQQADVNLYYYNARWYDPALGRFIQADSVVIGVYDAINWNSYTYVKNNPMIFVDSNGHSADCGINDPYCQNLKPRTDDPTLDCISDPHCKAAYRTYTEVSSSLRREPTLYEVLQMTATAEYYAYIYNKDAGSLRVDAQEALARNLYQANKTNHLDNRGNPSDMTTDNQIYKMLSGFEAWWRVDSTPYSRAENLLCSARTNKYVSELDSDIQQILSWDYVDNPSRRWSYGLVAFRPWQWINKPYKPSSSGDLKSNKGAILYISIDGADVYGGNYFWVVTGRQDYCNKPEHAEEKIFN